MEAAVKVLKMDKSAGVDNIPAELVQAGGEPTIDNLTSIGNKIWKTREWPTTWTQSLVITLPKKGNLQLCQNYRTISLISYPSKVILKIILNRLQPQAEEIIAEEQAGFGNRWCKREYVEPDALKEWKVSIFKIVDQRIKFYSQNTNLLPPKPKSTFRHLKQGIQDFHRKYVLVPADKAANNVVVV